MLEKANGYISQYIKFYVAFWDYMIFIKLEFYPLNASFKKFFYKSYNIIGNF
jgi:hypothetical protein